ncbi:MAG: diphosphomevalonate decarboxylase [Nanoarchaeota archaeon]|nr:diphosphomevalonate decarboxylase [Nanoarchaeota archaeon]
MTAKKASAIANANIALSKYWGKRDEKLHLPQNSSISMTTEGLFAHTTVCFDAKFTKDSFVLDGKNIAPDTPEFKDYIGNFLTFVKKEYNITEKARIESKNNFPGSAGLASSAAGFAALATAVNSALGLGLDEKGLSILARRGSGSACRSILGGFVEWKKGVKDDGSDSYAVELATADHWKDFRMVFCITSLSEKKIKSRAGMNETVKTSPFYAEWLKTVESDLARIRQGILEKDFTIVGQTAENNALKMHSLMMTTEPSIMYWNSGTLEVIDAVLDIRDKGMGCYFTMDAGPQVKIICLAKDVEKIMKKIEALKSVEKMIVSRPGEGAYITDDHLF